ncbi:hypothetical protein KPH14_003960 [Odynerus spinipes]|uniref:PCNA-associated factor n=1 Tax=Odynerus spinipes TaxID=1348599 RepID=A0AAD9RYE3_9HYME|nr:hypothetical protein KPH14_003960 [Odynerus spinipes]
MVRTKADRVPAKAVGAKAPHKVANSGGSKKPLGGSRGRNYSGGNPYHPRETPEWQKPITNFLNQSTSTEYTGSSTSKATENDGNNENDTSIVETD